MLKFQCLDLPFDVRTDILEAILDQLHHILPGNSGTISLSILDDARMRELNKEYRGLDSVTDVLSFHYYEDFTEQDPEETVAEIVFSNTKIEEQAREYSHTPEIEFYRLTVHGLVHILGYDHETDQEYQEMWKIEGRILRHLTEKFGILPEDSGVWSE